MQLLLARCGGTSLALPVTQIDRVLSRPTGVNHPVLRLDAALGLSVAPDPEDEGRLLVASSPAGAVGFMAFGELAQRDARAGGLSRLPRLLPRLGAPAWLAGLFLDGEVMSLVVDLRRLADQVQRISAAAPMGPPPPDRKN